mmetsp:Transcript_41437/g.129770  ORF Transcript_41437/g.129770 Transcript_41437/m.129770 type:complete len:151 (+) Transcript_41437:166-618(+)
MSKGGPLFSAADLQAGAKGLEDAGPAESKGAKSGGGDDKESFSMIDTLGAQRERSTGRSISSSSQVQALPAAAGHLTRPSAPNPSPNVVVSPVAEALYEKHNGDIRSIFDELGENPGKCLKYPPADAKEFAERYFDGGYTYVDQDKGGSK